jgi:hypothetical protein
MERLKAMKERLMTCVESQMGDLSKTNAEELGEVVDMIKDLEETIYYCTVVEAMEKKEEEPKREMMYYPVMYYNDGKNMSSRNRYYYPESSYYDDAYSRGMRDYANVYPREIRDYREGRSGNSRRMYMESKEMHEGKEKQMAELEKYMKELSGDVMEMINDATLEEKQILSQKLITLAEKIK